MKATEVMSAFTDTSTSYLARRRTGSIRPAPLRPFGAILLAPTTADGHTPIGNHFDPPHFGQLGGFDFDFFLLVITEIYSFEMGINDTGFQMRKCPKLLVFR